MSDYYNIFHSRQFPERNRIIFQYPPTKDGEDIIVFLPFYENPKITETQSANYAEYNPIGRAGTLYAYTGASSRKFKVKMYLTVPHMAMHEMGIDRFMRVFKGSSNKSEKLLFTQHSNISSEAKPGDADNSLSLSVEKMYHLLKEQNIGPEPMNPSFGFSSNALGSEGSSGEIDMNPRNLARLLQTLDVPPTYEERHKVLDTLLFFLALLRTSVTNNAENPLQGPPLLRLDFGTMYQAVPCICKSYNMQVEDDAGWDLETMTPRRLSISLSLEEVRIGDFSLYDPAVAIKRDNLAGWESAIASPFTTDPLPSAGFWKDGNMRSSK